MRQLNILAKFGTMTPASSMMPPIEKALIIRLSSVGDILLSTPLIRVLRQQYPECRLDYLVKREFAEVVRHNPYLSSVIELEPGSFDKIRSMRGEIRSRGYDLVIDIHDSLRSRYLCAGERNVVKINKRRIARFVLISTGIDLYGSSAHSVTQRYLDTMSSFGVEDDRRGLEIHIPDELRDRAERTIAQARRPLIGIAAGASRGTKMWSPDGFTETAVTLSQTTGTDIILFGSAAEADLCVGIEQAVRSRDGGIGVINMAGKTTLLEAAALMDHCRVVITNDSGLMHLATARKRPVVALFGPTVRQFGFFPVGSEHVVVQNKGLSCRPCSAHGTTRCPKGHFRCMNDISPASVIDAARGLMSA
ncbi:MAG: lipopolysaccharide heptosyltransferase II [Ignavibacteria bacterium]|nr:lipopolysaccharide heptosyltransferase II [Ignavibacteria bacterium]